MSGARCCLQLHGAEPEPLADVSSLAALGRSQGRLRVGRRGALTANAAQLFSSPRAVPMLVIESSRPEA